MLMEEGTAGPGFTYIAENGTDTLVLEHQVGTYASEGSPIDNGSFKIIVKNER